MLITLEDLLPTAQPKIGWIDGNLYKPASEVAGILPIPRDTRTEYGMQDYNPDLHAQQKDWFQASLQHTAKPVLPIHSVEDKIFFRDLFTQHSSSVFVNGSSAEPQWVNLVRAWNQAADINKNMSYKVSTYFT
jgi:hypothetical protein